MKLVDFYREVITSLGLTTNEEGYVYSGSGDSKMLFHVEGKTLVLPTKEHLSSLFETDEDGNINLVKLPYNPLNEDVVKGDSLSFKKTKVLAERRLSNAIYFAGDLLLLLASNPALQKKTSLEINKFLSSLSVAKNQNIKELVDDKSISTWESLYMKTIASDKGILSIYVKKTGVHEGVKYNRLATVSSPLYDDLCNYDKEVPVYGLKLRAKDATVYKLILKYLLNLDGDNSTISLGSNDNESPAFISLYKLYLTIATRINAILDELKNIDIEQYEAGYIHTNITLSMLDKLNMYRGELLTIPNENDLNRTKVVEQQTQPVMQQPINQLPTQQQYNQYQQPLDMSKPLPYQQPVEEDPIKRILYGNNIPVIPSMQKGTLPVMQQQMYKQPMGINNPMQQQMYQQPMVQQAPMGINNPMQQQMYQQPVVQQAPMGINNPIQQQMYQQPVGMNNPMQQQMYQQPMVQQAPMGINSNMFRFN